MMSPVLILGMARTGTTWVGNILMRNFQLFTPSHFLHYGVKESNLYTYNKLFERVPRDKFLEEIRNTDLFRLLTPDISKLENENFDNFYQLFFHLMDQRTLEKRKQSWFTKLSPEFIYDYRNFEHFEKELFKRYPEYRLIIISRSELDYIVSYLGMPGFKADLRRYLKYLSLLIGLSRFRLFYKNIDRLKSKQQMKLRYEDLIQDYHKSCQQVSKFLGLNFNQTQEEALRNDTSCKSAMKTNLIFKFIDFLTKSNFLNYWIIKIYSIFSNSKPNFHYRIDLFENDPQKLIEILKDRKEYKLAEDVINRINQ